MSLVALRMLLGDRTKYLGLVFGVAFATLLIGQQAGIFTSLMQRTAGVIRDAREVDLWVSDRAVDYLDGPRPLREGAVDRVQAVPGVAWAVPLHKALVGIRTDEGRIENALLVGVDDATLVGVPRRWVVGGPADLGAPDAVAIDEAGFRKLWPDAPIQAGREIDIGGHRAVVRAVSRAGASFASSVVMHARRTTTARLTGSGRRVTSFVLARAVDSTRADSVARMISVATGFRARTADAFTRDTIGFYLANTGIPVNFGAVIVLGVIVGAAIVGLTFSMFVRDNLKQYATLKAIGATDAVLGRMVMLKAACVGLIGFGLGFGATAAFFHFATGETSELRGFSLPGWVVLSTAALMVFVIVGASWGSLRRVRLLDPATVLRG
jgi:putative ABC transport system permease protein